MTSTPLDLYTGHGRNDARDPDLCPVETASPMGRLTRFAQCTRKPRSDMVRPVKGRFTNGASAQDLPVCGFHAGVYDRYVAKHEAADTARRIGDAKKANAKAAAEILRDEFGLEAILDYAPGTGSRMGGYTGKVVVDPAALLALLRATPNKEA